MIASRDPPRYLRGDADLLCRKLGKTDSIKSKARSGAGLSLRDPINRLVINLQRTENVVEGTVEVSGLALRRYGYHIKHSAIP